MTATHPAEKAADIETTRALDYIRDRNGTGEWYLGVGGATIYQNHGMERVRIATVHGSTELIPHAEQERNARLIVNAGRAADELRNIQANLTGRDYFPERVADSLRRIERVLRAIEGRAE